MPLSSVVLTGALAVLGALSAAAAPPAAGAAAGTYVQVLGVAQDAGHPQAGCERACCVGAWQGQGHLVASLAIVDGGRHWIIDATPDMRVQAHGLPGTLAGIFLTHAHMGHYTGLMHLGREAQGTVDVPVHAMPRMRGFLESNGPWDQLVTAGNIALSTLVEGQPLALSPTLSITAFSVPHRDEYSETVGYIVRGAERSVAWLPDIDKWERWARPVEDLLAQVDVAYLDATFFDGDELPGRDMALIPHPFVVESMARFAALPPETRAKVRFVHLNHSNPLLDPTSQASRTVRDAGLAVAQEGQVVDLGSAAGSQP